MYRPHPEEISEIFDADVQLSREVYRVALRDLARLQQICRRLQRRIVAFGPTHALIFARGGIPINFALMDRLSRGDSTRSLVMGSVFHLFPSLNGFLGSRAVNGLNFFIEEMIYDFRDKGISEAKIFVADASRAGNAANRILNTLVELGRRSQVRINLDLHLLLDAEGNESRNLNSPWEIPGPGGRTLRVFRPALLSDTGRPARGTEVSGVCINSWNYYPVGNLFCEDLVDFLGAGIVGRESMPTPVRNSASVIYTRDNGDDASGNIGVDELAKRFMYTLSERGPSGTTCDFRNNVNQARHRPDTSLERETGISMEDVIRYLNTGVEPGSDSES